jgi:transcriptional regulator with XRE-family HTH domain|nr:MAG TPA: helix-turn-helix domain protein [Caudoviricetes sp.]
MTLGKRIREIRLENDMSLRDFAKVVGVTDTTVMKWEKDERKISFENAIKISKTFDAPLDLMARSLEETKKEKALKDIEGYVNKKYGRSKNGK